MSSENSGAPPAGEYIRIVAGTLRDDKPGIAEQLDRDAVRLVFLESTVSAQAAEIERLSGLVAEYEQALASKRENTRLLDIAMHGEEGAAKQASLCDLIQPAEEMRAEIERLREALGRIAAFEDDLANRHLANTRSYASFDEPNSVQIARTALQGREKNDG